MEIYSTTEYANDAELPGAGATSGANETVGAPESIVSTAANRIAAGAGQPSMSPGAGAPPTSSSMQAPEALPANSETNLSNGPVARPVESVRGIEDVVRVDKIKIATWKSVQDWKVHQGPTVGGPTPDVVGLRLARSRAHRSSLGERGRPAGPSIRRRNDQCRSAGGGTRESAPSHHG